MGQRIRRLSKNELTLSEQLLDECASGHKTGKACHVCLRCEAATTLDFLNRPLDDVVLSKIHREVGQELDHTLGWKRDHPVKLAWHYIGYAMKQQERAIQIFRRRYNQKQTRIRTLERELKSIKARIKATRLRHLVKL